MPEVCFQVQWPDGQCSTLYSPSTVIHEYLNPGDCLTVSQMEARGLEALSAASERVRARYGFACTRTDEESARLREWVARYGPEDSVKIISQLA